jgi:hypothetical protein
MSKQNEERERFDRLSHLRGFDPLKRIDNNPARVRLRRSDEVWYEGKAYRVVDVMGSPKLEPVVKPK